MKHLLIAFDKRGASDTLAPKKKTPEPIHSTKCNKSTDNVLNQASWKTIFKCFLSISDAKFKNNNNSKVTFEIWITVAFLISYV